MPDQAHSVCAASLFDHRGLAEFLRGQKDLGRIGIDRDEVMTSLGDLYGFDQLVSFVAAAPANVLRHELHTARTQALFGVTHYVGRTAPPDSGAPIATFGDGLMLFREQSALPRAWIAHRVLYVGDAGELQSAVRSPETDLLSTAMMLHRVPDLEARSGQENVSWRRPDPNSVVLDCDLRSRGMVILSDLDYPGWVARLDGVLVPMYEADGAFRSVVVPTGRHRVEMSYKPLTVRAGMALTLAGLVVSFVLLLAWRRGSSRFGGI